MKATTHVGFAELLYLVLLTSAGVGLTLLNTLVVAVASILPDIDSGATTIGRLVPPVTRFLERRFGHRTLTHSILCIAVLVLLFLVPLLAGIDLFACIILGYASHPVLDTCTRNGVRLFYPFSGVRCVFPFDANAPHRFRVETSSKLDRALGLFFLAACIPAWFIAYQGYERFIRVAQHSIESAVRDYEVFARSGTVSATIDAHDNLGCETLKGTFPVVGALNPRSLVFLGADGRLHTVGREFESDFVADNIVCVRGEPARTTVRTVDMGGRPLGALEAEGDSSGESYFFGEIVTAETPVIPARVACFAAVSCSGHRLRLNYARGGDLRELNLSLLQATAGTVVIKTVHREVSSRRTETPPSIGPGGTSLAFVVTSGEQISFLKKSGDTVQAGEILARRTLPAVTGELGALNDRKRRTSEAGGRSALLALDRAIADALVAFASDSVEYLGAAELVARGYASPASLAHAELKRERSKRALGKLLAGRDLMAGKLALERAHFALADAELRAKKETLSLRSEFRSPWRGILIDVRREPAGARERIVFILRKLPPEP
ncbi:MAG TPA: metal-dependent hydrolase [Bacteroidota bacterium]|nr:metal-dependent hydrolase [Bacteroidota bacterium]